MLDVTVPGWVPIHGLPARIGAVLCAVLSSTMACSDGVAPLDAADVPLRDQSPLQTEALAYRLERRTYEYRAIVRATFVNSTDAPIHYKRCMPNSAEPMFHVARTGADSGRTFFVDWAWACVGGVPTGVLASGDSITIEARFGSVDQPSMNPPLQAEQLVGQFRIYLDLCTRFTTDSDYCELQTAIARRSNAFLIHY